MNQASFNINYPTHNIRSTSFGWKSFGRQTSALNTALERIVSSLDIWMSAKCLSTKCLLVKSLSAISEFDQSLLAVCFPALHALAKCLSAKCLSAISEFDQCLLAECFPALHSSAKCQSAKCLSAKCLSVRMSFGKKSVSKNLSVKHISVKCPSVFFWPNVSQPKGNWQKVMAP